MYELQNRMKKTGYVVAHIKEKIKEEEYTSATALRTMTWAAPCTQHGNHIPFWSLAGCYRP
jgi:hypothetical protein